MVSSLHARHNHNHHHNNNNHHNNNHSNYYYDEIIHWQGQNDLKTFIKAYFKDHNRVCDLFPNSEAESSASSRRHRRILLNITFGCHDVFTNAGAGSENFMVGFYAIRLAAAAANANANVNANVNANANTGNHQPTTTMDVLIDCFDAWEQRHQLLLPWMTGWFPADATRQSSLSFLSPNNPSTWLSTTTTTTTTTTIPIPTTSSTISTYADIVHQDACGNIDACPIGFLFRDIQNDLRRMAVALVGIPTGLATASRVEQWWRTMTSAAAPRQPKSPQPLDASSGPVLKLPLPDYTAAQQQQQYTPLYSNVELDDTVIHFRCGDLMASQHPRFAFLKYSAMARPIFPTTTTIGIVTQPFHAGAQSRAWDASAVKRQRCRIVVTDFVQYLHERFPHARIRIHNDPNETIALTYARMILANQSIAGISTFGVFPSIATFGTGYIRWPDEKSPTNQWLLHPRLDHLMATSSSSSLTSDTTMATNKQQQLVLLKEPNILMVRKMQKLWEQENAEQTILRWFRDDSIRYD